MKTVSSSLNISLGELLLPDWPFDVHVKICLPETKIIAEGVRNLQLKVLTCKRSISLHMYIVLNIIQKSKHLKLFIKIVHTVYFVHAMTTILVDRCNFFCPSVALIGIDGGNTTKMSRFANYLRNLLPSNDQVVMQMASKAMGRLALTGGTFTADYVEFEVKRALEWLGGDRNEGRRHAAVSIVLSLLCEW